MSKNILDVRQAIWEAYKWLESTPDGVDGKISEGYCELLFPNIWDCKTALDFQIPHGIMIYSYAFGPSRSHYIWHDEKESHPNYYTWHSPDIYAKAIEVVNSWVEETKQLIEEGQGER